MRSLARLDLLSAVAGDPPPASVYQLRKAPAGIQAADPKLADSRQFQKLNSYAASDR
jgi:hypothetical protein